MLRDRQLRAIVVARFVSLTGTNMTTVALPWFVLVTTGSAARMGLVLAVQLLPSVVLGVLSGSVVARIGPRRALVLADLLRAPLLTAVPVLYWLGALSFALLLVIVALIGVFQIPYAAAANTLLPELVGEDEGKVAQATAALQVAIQTTGVIGPILAGLLIPVVGTSAILVLDGASYLVSGLIVVAAVSAGRPRARESTSRGALVGVRHLSRDALLSAIVLAALVAHFGLVALFATLPAYAFQSLADPRAAGVLFAADAVGSVLGGLLAMRVLQRVPPMRVAVIGFVAMATPLWLLVLAPPLPVVVSVMFLFGVGGPLGVAPIGAVLTTRAPAEIRPQVVSAFFAITAIGSPLGAVTAGYAIGSVGFGATYVLIAASMTAGTLLLAVFARRAADVVEPRPAPVPS